MTVLTSESLCHGCFPHIIIVLSFCVCIFFSKVCVAEMNLLSLDETFYVSKALFMNEKENRIIFWTQTTVSFFLNHKPFQLTVDCMTLYYQLFIQLSNFLVCCMTKSIFYLLIFFLMQM